MKFAGPCSDAGASGVTFAVGLTHSLMGSGKPAWYFTRDVFPKFLEPPIYGGQQLSIHGYMVTVFSLLANERTQFEFSILTKQLCTNETQSPPHAGKKGTQPGTVELGTVHHGSPGTGRNQDCN